MADDGATSEWMELAAVPKVVAVTNIVIRGAVAIGLPAAVVGVCTDGEPSGSFAHRFTSSAPYLVALICIMVVVIAGLYRDYAVRKRFGALRRRMEESNAGERAQPRIDLLPAMIGTVHDVCSYFDVEAIAPLLRELTLSLSAVTEEEGASLPRPYLGMLHKIVVAEGSKRAYSRPPVGDEEIWARRQEAVYAALAPSVIQSLAVLGNARSAELLSRFIARTPDESLRLAAERSISAIRERLTEDPSRLLRPAERPAGTDTLLRTVHGAPTEPLVEQSLRSADAPANSDAM